MSYAVPQCSIDLFPELASDSQMEEIQRSYTPKQAAEQLGISIEEVVSLIEEQKIRAFKC